MSTCAAHRPLRADHAARPRCAAAPPTGGRCSRCSPGTCPTAGATASWPGPAGSSTRWRRFRFDDEDTRLPARQPGGRRAHPATSSPTTGSPATSAATARASCYFPGSPILIVEGTFAEAVLLETLALSILNHDCAIASAASRMVHAAGSRPLIEMGSRRTHEQAAVAAARAAYLAGFASTSNLDGRTRCTACRPPAPARTRSRCCTTPSAHAFQAQIDALGPGTTLLVDTYDVAQAVRDRGRAGRARARRGPHRLRRPGRGRPARSASSSTRSARSNTRIVVTGDLDEYAIAALAAAPVDGYGVGTVAGHRLRRAHGRAGLQARGPRGRRRACMRPVAKTSVGKPSSGGRKWAFRKLDATGTAIAELVTRRRPARPTDGVPLLVPAGQGRRGRRPRAPGGGPRAPGTADAVAAAPAGPAAHQLCPGLRRRSRTVSSH